MFISCNSPEPAGCPAHNCYCLFGVRWSYIDGLVQKRRNSSALAMELCLSCTNQSIYIPLPTSTKELKFVFSRFSNFLDENLHFLVFLQVPIPKNTITCNVDKLCMAN